MLATASGAVAAPPAGQQGPANMPLAFGQNGQFKIVQFNDTQDGPRTDRRTIEFMGKVLDAEKPGFALINGDVINGSPRTELEVRQAINNVVQPMESRGIKWALTFGNHDEDSMDNGTGMTEARMLEFIRGYQHNLNAATEKGIEGSSNAQLLIRSASSNTPAFGVWLLDSGRYAPDSLGGQDFEGLMGYDWIRPSQIQWYREASVAAEQRYGRKVQSLMFFHIPLFEHHHMWFGSQFTSDEAGHAAAVTKHGIVGVKNEDVYTGAFNSGLFAALQERGDVRGVFVGHDHINTYSGNYFGIDLGYGPGTGFGTYGLGGDKEHHLRGARVFELDERADQVYAGTRTVFAKDLGIDMDPQAQPLDEPLPLP
jgi:Calcineurin-like phosphoesterase